MAEGTPRSAGGKAGLARSLVPSVVILAGVFWFINSACLGDDSDDSNAGSYQPCAFALDTATPPGASASIVSPSDDQLFSASAADGLGVVPVLLSAHGIEITPARVCRAKVGYFVLTVERTAGEGCVEPSVLRPIQLSHGALEAELQLPAGTYSLTAQIVNATGLAYQPEVTARVRFTVEGPAPSFDGGLCP